MNEGGEIWLCCWWEQVKTVFYYDWMGFLSANIVRSDVREEEEDMAIMQLLMFRH